MEVKLNNQNHYNSIDGLRAISCLCIIAMHVRANTQYLLKGNFMWDKFIPSWTWLVYLFLMISGFGMCAGYLKKFHDGKVDLDSFYARRYSKILPFFGFLILIAVVMEHSTSGIYEGIVEFTLLHGLLPNNAVSIMGVCWTLGVIFLFYLLFPFFTVLLKNKKRAWLSLLVSLCIIVACIKHFFGDYFVTASFTPRHSFIYCIPLFIGGGIVYLYRNELKNIGEKFRWPFLVICLGATVLYYILPTYDLVFYLKLQILFMLWLSYAVSVESKFLSSKFMKFFSGISMEMYLAQMIIFRVIEKIHFGSFNALYAFGNSGIGGWLSYIVVFVIEIIGLVIFIQIYKLMYRFVKKNWTNILGKGKMKK